MEVVWEGLQPGNSYEMVERGSLKPESCESHVDGCGSWHIGRCTEAAGPCLRGVFVCIHMWSVQLGTIFYIDPLFLVDEIMHEKI